MKIILKSIFIIAAAIFTAFANAQPDTAQSLTEKQKAIISITAVAAKGNLSKLKSEITNGLDLGLTVNQIKESMVHLYAYAGFPRSIRGLQIFMEVLDQRKTDGVADELGPTASLVKDDRSKYERGVETLYDLTGRDWSNPKSGYSAFAPLIDQFLKEHLFADIFERDVLTYQQRELVTISVLSSIGGVSPMLKGHYNICLHLGLSPNQLKQFVKIIQSTIGKKEAKAARAVLNEVLQENKQEIIRK